jgi:hypothetical protein
MRPEIPFKFELPLEVWYKAGEKGKERRIGGVISTESRDRQGEVVLQRGLDFSEFVQNGWFNDNHSRETTGIVGYPVKVEKRMHNGRPGTYVEGYLLDNYEPANRIWELANSLQKTGRRLGFSIEGGVLRRSGPSDAVIAEAKVRNVAITNCPVNTETGLDVLAKSLRAVEQASDEWFTRALMAGHAINPSAPMAGSGFALRAESMEMVADVAAAQRKKRKLTKAEAINLLKARYRGMTDGAAERILQFTMAQAA